MQNMTPFSQICMQSSLLFYGLALETIHDLQRAVSFTPVDTVGQLAAATAGDHRRDQADMGPHQAVEHGQLRGDTLHTLAH